MYEVIDQEIDEAGKFRVRVSIKEQVVMFKFQSEPISDEIQAEAEKYSLLMQEQIAKTGQELIDPQTFDILVEEVLNVPAITG